MCYNKIMIFTIDEIRNKINENKQFFERNFSVKNFFLFGSYAKGLQTNESDIDLLVEFSKEVDMFTMVDLQECLANLFNKKIDLGTPQGLKNFIKKQILQEAVLL